MSPIRYENNTFRNNNLHMVLIQATESEVVNNRFEGTAPSFRSVGVWLTGSNIRLVENVFEGMPTGIRFGGEDPEWGTALGYAIDSELLDNRFRDVSEPKELQSRSIRPDAIKVEERTLYWPYPEPILAEVAAVMVCWPEIEEGFQVESAPTPEGPWTLLDVPVMQRNGNHCIAVPSDDQSAYFRLVSQE